MSYYLFLDDSRHPSRVDWVKLPELVEWVIVKNYTDFVQPVNQRGVPKFVTYDCDLCDEHYAAYFELKEMYPSHHKEFKQKCGIECAEYLIDYCKRAKVPHPEYLVHSKNQYGGLYIKNLIEKSLNPKAVSLNVSELPSPNLPEYCEHSDKMISGFFCDYRYLSNFWPAEVEYKGLKFRSTECAYQAAKSKTYHGMLPFTTASSSEAKKLGKNIELRDDWSESTRISIMTYLVFQKFSKDTNLCERLMSTGDKVLIESNSWKDNFWGVNYQKVGLVWFPDGGRNMLGQILMNVRKALK